MAAVVPTTVKQLSLGNIRGVVATFTAISDTETWAPGLSTIDYVGLTNGANDVDTGATISGGTITFQCAGAMANVRVLAIGS